MSSAGEEPSIAGVDLSRANVARMYDYILGGSHNFAVDRELADRLVAAEPDLVAGIRATRSFVRRVVTLCLRHGIDQFLDLGSGLPTVGNVHEVARRSLPDARVVYVDHEAIAVHHSRDLLRGLDGVAVLQADVRDPDGVLSSDVVRSVLDLDRPVAVLLLAVLHFVPGDAEGLVAAYRRVLAPGSAIAVSHGSTDWDDPALARSMRVREESYRDSSQPLTSRTRHEIAALFAGTEIVDPGLVEIADWRPDSSERVRSGVYGAVGFVPAQP